MIMIHIHIYMMSQVLSHIIYYTYNNLHICKKKGYILRKYNYCLFSWFHDYNYRLYNLIITTLIPLDSLIKIPEDSTTLSGNTSHTKLDTKNSSPYDILKRHTSELLSVISGPDKLANDLSSVDLISDQVKDDVLTTLGISRYQKCSILLNEIQRSLNVFNERERLISFCEVLKQQNDWTLSRICDDMMRQLGTNDIS